MADKVLKMLDLLAPHFSRKHESEKAEIEWLSAWKSELGKEEPWVLEAAARRLVRTRKERYFPQVAEVLEVCKEILNEERRSKPSLAIEQAPKLDRFAFAERLLDCNLGREAARDNPSWVVPLHDFIVENGRLPTGPEITRCKRIAHDGEQIEYAITTGKVSALLPQMQRMRENIRDRRERFRRMLLGAEADNPAPSTFVPNPNYMDEERARYRARMPENHRLASEWMDKTCTEYGTFENWHKQKRPPGSPFQNKRRGGEA